MARYSIAGIHLEMYHSLLQINFGTMFPEDQAMMFCPDCPRTSAIRKGPQPCPKHTSDPVCVYFEDGGIKMVVGCPLERDGVRVIERGDPDALPATIADDWKLSVNPSEWRHGIESLQLDATNGLINYCILYRRRPLPYRFQL